MNPADALNLRDIYLPDAVSWWPPAVGWWVSGILLLIIIVGFWLFIKRLKAPSLIKSAKVEIEQIISLYESHADQQRLVQELSIALRRIGISYLPREQAAGVLGRAWYDQLNQLSKKATLSDEVIRMLLQAPYQKSLQMNEQQIETLTQQIGGWVSGLAER